MLAMNAMPPLRLDDAVECPVKEAPEDSATTPVKEVEQDANLFTPVKEVNVELEATTPVKEVEQDANLFTPVKEVNVELEATTPVKEVEQDVSLFAPVKEKKAELEEAHGDFLCVKLEPRDEQSEAFIHTPVKEENFNSEESSGDHLSLETSDLELKSEPDPEPGTSGSATPCALTVLSSSDSDSPRESVLRPSKRPKSRKRHCSTSSSSSSGSSSSEEIDYNNLKPEELKALIEEARRIRATKKKCKCPKTRWEELPVKGPIKPSGKCTIGKGDWSEGKTDCAYCSSGIAHIHHVPRDPWQLEKRSFPRRKRTVPTRLNIIPLPPSDRVKATVAGDIPVVELDSDDNSLPTVVGEEVTVASSDSVIVLSSDEDEIVCEMVIKRPAPFAAPLPPALPMPVPAPSPVQVVAEPWPEPNIDLGNIDLAYNLLADLGRPSGAAAEPEVRPATPPEEWSCPVCLETKSSVSEIMSTVCGHIFCGPCIRSAVKAHHKCPTCRKKLTVKQFHKIFL